MTAEKALEILKKESGCAHTPNNKCKGVLRSCNGCPHQYNAEDLLPAIDKAIEIAVEALGMPRASDLISRKMAIIQLSHNKTGDDDCDVVIQRDIETIKSLPSVRPERKLGK